MLENKIFKEKCCLCFIYSFTINSSVKHKEIFLTPNKKLVSNFLKIKWPIMRKRFYNRVLTAYYKVENLINVWWILCAFSVKGSQKKRLLKVIYGKTKSKKGSPYFWQSMTKNTDLWHFAFMFSVNKNSLETKRIY